MDVCDPALTAIAVLQTVAQLTKACNQLLRDVVSVESGGAKKRLVRPNSPC